MPTRIGGRSFFCSTGVADWRPRGALTWTVGSISPWFKGRAVPVGCAFSERRSPDPTNERSNGRIFVDLCQRVNGPRDHRTYHVVEIFFSWAFGYDHYENSRRIWYPDLWNLQHYRYQLTPEDFFADRYAFIWARWLRFRSTAERLKVMLKTGHPVW